MRLVFVGTSDFATPALRSLAPHVTLVVTQPDRPSGRGLKLQPSPVKLLALELGLPVDTPEKSRSPEFVERILAEEPDALIVAAYGQILSQRLLDSATRGGINLHGSILPKYRGAAPIQHAILAGDQETGVTLMQMDKGMDTGDIIAIEATPIGQDETYSELHLRLAEMAAQLIEAWIERIVSGDYPRLPQDPEAATYAPKIEAGDRQLSVHRPADKEYDRFRALTSSPGAILPIRGQPVKVHEARLKHQSGTPGQILSSEPFVVAFEKGSLELKVLQAPGRSRQAAADFVNGHRLRSGDSIL